MYSSHIVRSSCARERAAGFHPFYSSKQTGAAYLKVQEGSQSLYSAYEVAYGNVLR